MAAHCPPSAGRSEGLNPKQEHPSRGLSRTARAPLVSILDKPRLGCYHKGFLTGLAGCQNPSDGRRGAPVCGAASRPHTALSHGRTAPTSTIPHATGAQWQRVGAVPPPDLPITTGGGARDPPAKRQTASYSSSIRAPAARAQAQQVGRGRTGSTASCGRGGEWQRRRSCRSRRPRGIARRLMHCAKLCG